MKRTLIMVVLVAVLLVSLASSALAAQTGSVLTGNGNCQVLANGEVPGDNTNGRGHARGLYRAHNRAANVFGTVNCT